MSNNLMQAHRQWANRPADERFRTLADMHKATVARQKSSTEATVDLRTARFTMARSIGNADDRAKVERTASDMLLTPTHLGSR